MRLDPICLVAVDKGNGHIAHEQVQELTSFAMRPMNLVSLSNRHTDAVLPWVLRSIECCIIFIIVAALETLAALMEVNWSRSILVVLACGVMFGSDVPMHVHRAQTCKFR